MHKKWVPHLKLTAAPHILLWPLGHTCLIEIFFYSFPFLCSRSSRCLKIKSYTGSCGLSLFLSSYIRNPSFLFLTFGSSSYQMPRKRFLGGKSDESGDVGRLEETLEPLRVASFGDWGSGMRWPSKAG